MAVIVPSLKMGLQALEIILPWENGQSASGMIFLLDAKNGGK